MGLRDLIFGREEEEEEEITQPESKQNPVAKEKVGGNAELSDFELREKKAVAPPAHVAPSVAAPEVEAELKTLKGLLDQEKREKNLGTEYFGFIKALGDQIDDDAHERTLRTLNAVREQFSVGGALTWKMLIDSAKSCMAWLSGHAQQRVSKMQEERRTSNANFVLQIQKAETSIQDNEEKILRLKKEIEEQKALRQAALEAQKKAELEFERKKTTFDTATVQLANDIATDISRFQSEG